MRTGIARGLLLRLSAVEQRRSKARSIGLWPAIMGSEKWERSAVPMQAKLMAATAWDPTAAPPPAPLPDLSDVSHRYKRPDEPPRRGQTAWERKMYERASVRAGRP